MENICTQSVADTLGICTDRVCLIGSQRIIGSGNDWDFLVLFNNDRKLIELGFSRDLDDQMYPAAFTSWRKGDINLVVTPMREFFISECTVVNAAAAAVQFGTNLSSRELRVVFHGHIRNHVRPHLDAYIPEMTPALEIKL